MKYANCIGYTDITPWEVVRIVSEKTIEIRPMDSVRDPDWKPEFVEGGFVANCTNQWEQRWIITSSDDYNVERIRLGKNGKWKNKWGAQFVLADEPRKFYDFNF